MSGDATITLLVHTRDSVELLPRLLATTGWCDERIVVDMRSTDGTAELAVAAGCRVIDLAPEPFSDAVRNRALAEPRSTWTLVLDSDEFLAADAEAGLRALAEAATDDIGAFALPRSNEIAGQVLRGVAHFPDHQVRLFRTNSVRYVARHHRRPELLDPTLRVVDCDSTTTPWIHHVNARTLAEYIAKQVDYALTDDYDLGSDFSFDLVVAEGLEQFDARYEPRVDGSLSYALALVMYWDQIVRGLVEWEKRGMVDPLPAHPPFPPPHPHLPSESSVRRHEAATSTEAELREAVASLTEQLEALHRSRSMRLTAPVRRLARLLRPWLGGDSPKG